MKIINNFLEKNVKKIIFTFLFIQPLLDIIAGISINIFNIENPISSYIRLLFLLFCIYYLCFLNKNESKKKSFLFFVIVSVYLFIFGINTIYTKGTDCLFFEIKNSINTFYFPIVLVSFLNIIKQYKITISSKNIFCFFLIYLIAVFIPNILNIGFNSYAHSKLGSVGFFISANSVGNILSFLLPITIMYMKNTKKHIFNIIIFTIILYVFSSIGTKVPMLSLLITILGIIYYLIFVKKMFVKKILLYFILFITSGIILIPHTSFYKNLKIHMDYLKIENPIQIISNYKLIDHFIFSQRLTFFNKTWESYKKESLISKIIGIGYIENYSTDEVSTKTIEIDYFDILLRHGPIGFVIFFIPIVCVTKQKLELTNFENLSIKISNILIFLLAFFSGHLFVTPATSIFVICVYIYKFQKKITPVILSKT